MASPKFVDYRKSVDGDTLPALVLADEGDDKRKLHVFGVPSGEAIVSADKAKDDGPGWSEDAPPSDDNSKSDSKADTKTSPTTPKVR
jgi:hypothetical protein